MKQIKEIALCCLLLLCVQAAAPALPPAAVPLWQSAWADDEGGGEEPEEPEEPDDGDAEEQSPQEEESMGELLAALVDEAKGTLAYMDGQESLSRELAEKLEQLRAALVEAQLILDQERENEFASQYQILRVLLDEVAALTGPKVMTPFQTQFELVLNTDEILDIGEAYKRSTGKPLPGVILRPFYHGTYTAQVWFHPSSKQRVSLYETEETSAMANVAQVISLPVTAAQRGHYEIEIRFQAQGRLAAYDSVHFYAISDTYERPGGAAETVFQDETGAMQYMPDYKGNRVMDFSHCGYADGAEPIPFVEKKLELSPSYQGDESDRIQKAVDELSQMPQDETGFRGALVLKAGVYQISKPITIKTSGVVIRGEYTKPEHGASEDKVVIRSTQNRQEDCFTVAGPSSISMNASAAKIVTDQYVPSGSHRVHVENTAGFEIGQEAVLRVNYGNKWVAATQHDTLKNGAQAWEPFSINFERKIVNKGNDWLEFDNPVAQNIDAQLHTADVVPMTDKRIEKVGIENLQIVAGTDYFSASGDTSGYKSEEGAYFQSEYRARNGISLNNVKNAWVRDIETRYLDRLVYLLRGSKNCTVRDCDFQIPSSKITGGRRYSYNMEGQMNLVYNSSASMMRHAFVYGSRIPGPNVFYKCWTTRDYGISEAHHRWAVGGLYDNVTATLGIYDRGTMGTGHGWGGAWFTCWNTDGPLVIQTPPTAQNYSFGHIGSKRNINFSSYAKRYYECFGRTVSPNSLFVAQLEERIGNEKTAEILKYTDYAAHWN